jgi:hypothetical protein
MQLGHRETIGGGMETRFLRKALLEKQMGGVLVILSHSFAALG